MIGSNRGKEKSGANLAANLADFFVAYLTAHLAHLGREFRDCIWVIARVADSPSADD